MMYVRHQNVRHPNFFWRQVYVRHNLSALFMYYAEHKHLICRTKDNFGAKHIVHQKCGSIDKNMKSILDEILINLWENTV